MESTSKEKALHKAVKAMDSQINYPAQQIDTIRKFNVHVCHL